MDSQLLCRAGISGDASAVKHLQTHVTNEIGLKITPTQFVYITGIVVMYLQQHNAEKCHKFIHIATGA